LGSHQKCWIWGRNAVLETLKSPRWEILDLCLSSALAAEALREARQLAGERGWPVKTEPPEVLTRLCHSSEHQGYLARMTDFPYWAADQALAALPPAPLCAVLDGIQDPHNFGALIRSAEVFGVDALFIGASGQVGVTSMVVRSSAGAVNRVPIVRVEDVAHLAARLKARGLALVGASEKAQAPLSAVNFKRPTAIVIGSEGTGIQPALRAACDALAQIPQFGHVGSLNAAVAASIFFYEARRQRGAAVS